MQIHLHPDKFIYIRSGKDDLYADTLENFELDYGSKLDTLPEGFIERSYDGEIDLLKTDLSGVANSSRWVQGDDILSKVNTIVAAKNTRIAPKPKTPDEIAKEEARKTALAELKAVKPVMNIQELSEAVNKILIYLGVK